MPINILMPALSPTMEEGTLAKWLVKEGDQVSSGAVLAEIETDKATMEFEAVDEGTVGKIVVPEGTEGVKVNDLIAILLEEGESADAMAAAPAAKSEAKPAAAAPAAAAAAPAPTPPAAAPAGAKSGERVFASPLARRIAGEKGLDLGSIKGSGPHGRIVKSDVESARPGAAQPAAPAPEAAARPAAAAPSAPDAEAIKKLYADREYEEVKLDGMRKIIAARLSEAKQTIPHFYLRRENPAGRPFGVPVPAQQGTRGPRRETVGERLHHQGIGTGASGGPRLQRRLGR